MTSFKRMGNLSPSNKFVGFIDTDEKSSEDVLPTPGVILSGDIFDGQMHFGLQQSAAAELKALPDNLAIGISI